MSLRHPTNPGNERDAIRPRRWPLAPALALIVITGFAACGGDDEEGETTTPPTVLNAADKDVVDRIRIGTPLDEVVAQLGGPARIEEERAPVGDPPERVPVTCYVYGVEGGVPSDTIEMCFVKEELATVFVKEATDAAPGVGVPGAGAPPPPPPEGDAPDQP